MKEIYRLFIAVPLSIDLRRQFQNLIFDLRVKGADVKWVSESNFHITLKFLGDTQKSKIDEVSSILSKTILEHKSQRIHFQGIGTFPSMKRPKIFWIGLSYGYEYLKEIASSIEDAFATIGFEREKHDFKSHVTIGRMRTTTGIAGLMNYVESIKNFDGGDMNVKEIHLMRSELKREGAIYSVLEKFPLLAE